MTSKLSSNPVTRPTDPNPHRGLLYVIAVFKLAKALLLLLISFGAFRLVRQDVEQTITYWVEHIRLDPHNRFIHHVLAPIFGLSPRRLHELGVGTFIYAALFTTEGIGLLLRKRWAEYMTVISTALLLPVEGYEIYLHATAVKFFVLLVNIGIVAYLAARLGKSAPPHRHLLKWFTIRREKKSH